MLHNINLDVAEGEFVIFVGPSGCGISTLLRIIAGLEDTSGGACMIDGRRMDNVFWSDARKRPVAGFGTDSTPYQKPPPVGR